MDFNELGTKVICYYCILSSSFPNLEVTRSIQEVIQTEFSIL